MKIDRRNTNKYYNVVIEIHPECLISVSENIGSVGFRYMKIEKHCFETSIGQKDVAVQKLFRHLNLSHIDGTFKLWLHI